MYICIYVYLYDYIYTHLYIEIYIESERERERREIHTYIHTYTIVCTHGKIQKERAPPCKVPKAILAQDLRQALMQRGKWLDT